MIREWFLTAAAGAAVAGTLLGAHVSGQSAAQATTDEFQQSVLAVVSKNCMGCHSDRLHTGSLSLEPFRDPALAAQKPEIWQKVLEKLEAGLMPPRPAAPLGPSDLAAVTGWIRKLPGISASRPAEDPSTADPGRVTARRLNRVEYNNTVRDLFGVSISPANEFPIDDSGYGFDNIGDVLTMSPMLMEKYISAARAVARAAVFGEPYPEKPGQLGSLNPKKLQDDSFARGVETPYALRGTLFAKFHFPVEAEYEFRWRYGNYRGRGKPVGPGRPFATALEKPAQPLESADNVDTPDNPGAPGARGRGAGGGRRGGGPPTAEERKAREAKMLADFPPILMVFSIDGQKAAEEYVEGDGNYLYAHGDNIARVRVTAGDHELRVSWPELANHPNAFRLVNADGRQELFIDSMRVLGPYNVSTAPPPGFKKIFICGERGKYSDACVKQIVTNLVTRAYRRPATSAEVDRLLTLVKNARRNDTVEQGIRLAIEAVLVSPNFLFRIEKDRAASGLYEIDDYALASRLSYFLWSSMPDEELFKLAETKQLHDPAVMNAQVQRMLRDAKAATLVNNFGEQWLNLRLMDRKKPDSLKFLNVDDELLADMRRETLLFIGAVVRENRSVLDFIDGRYTFINGPLARYYGIKGVDGEQFRRVDLDGEQRSGLVTQAAILSISSYATRTSPVLRGKWVLDTLLGVAPPPPPDNIPPLEEKDLGTAVSMRERLAQHRANPTCAVCHNQMDPIGFALEHYDAGGAWREKDGPFEIDSKGTLPDGRAVDGAKGLKAILRADAPAFARNFTEKLMTYALGRGLERSDRPVVEQISKDAARDDYRFASIIGGIVNSRAFRMRTASASN